MGSARDTQIEAYGFNAKGDLLTQLSALNLDLAAGPENSQAGLDSG